MTTRLRSVHPHPASTGSARGRPIVLIGPITEAATVAEAHPDGSTLAHRVEGPPRRNGRQHKPELVSAPPQVADMGRLLAASGALEVFYFRGAADLITGEHAHMLSLDPGCYLLARFPRDHEPMDGQVAAFTRQAEDEWPND